MINSLFIPFLFSSAAISCCTLFAVLQLLAMPYTPCLKNETDVAHYNFNAQRPILVIFSRDVTERVWYRMVICYPTCPNYCLYITRENVNPGNCLFSHAGYSPRPLTLSDWNEILRSGWSLGFSCDVRISCKSVKRFRSCGGRNLPFAIDLAKSVGKRPNQCQRALHPKTLSDTLNVAS